MQSSHNDKLWRGAKQNRWTNKCEEQNWSPVCRLFVCENRWAKWRPHLQPLIWQRWRTREDYRETKKLKKKKKTWGGGGFQQTKQHLFPPPQNQIGAWFCSTLVLPSVQFYGFVYCICHGALRRILKGYPAQCTGTYTCGYFATLEIIIGRNLGPVIRHKFRKTADLQ